MRMIVFFDLPVKTKRERKEATRFRKYLLDNGFMMMQYSVYVRIANGQDKANTVLNCIKRNLPDKGSIRCLTITEKQFAAMEFLVGRAKLAEKINSADTLLLI